MRRRRSPFVTVILSSGVLAGAGAATGCVPINPPLPEWDAGLDDAGELGDGGEAEDAGDELPPDSGPELSDAGDAGDDEDFDSGIWNPPFPEDGGSDLDDAGEPTDGGDEPGDAADGSSDGGE